MDSLKGWFIEVAIKKFGPSALRGAILGGLGWIAAEHEMLAKLGIVYDTATQVMTIHFNQLTVWAVALVPAIGAGAIKVINHQAVELVSPSIPEVK